MAASAFAYANKLLA